jgi:hypothetical protein
LEQSLQRAPSFGRIALQESAKIDASPTCCGLRAAHVQAHGPRRGARYRRSVSKALTLFSRSLIARIRRLRLIAPARGQRGHELVDLAAQLSDHRLRLDICRPGISDSTRARSPQ